MNKFLLVFTMAGALMAAPVLQAKTLKKAATKEPQMENAQALQRKVMAMNKAAEQKVWKPGTAVRYNWDTEAQDWWRIYAESYVYDEETGRMSSYYSNDGYERVDLTYNEDGYITVTANYNKDGDSWRQVYESVNTYDDKIPGYIIETLDYLFEDGVKVSSGGSRHVLTRNADGNVTNMQGAWYDVWGETPEWVDYSWYIAIEYGTDGKASTITEYYDDEVEISFTNIVWAATDGQIVDTDWDDAEFYLGANRMKSADVLMDGFPNTLKMTVEYPAAGAFKYEIKDGDMVLASQEYETLDEFGSYVRAESEVDFDWDEDTEQWVKDFEGSYWRMMVIDAYGQEVVDHSKEYEDGVLEWEESKTAQVTYDETYDYPTEYIWTMVQNDGTPQLYNRLVLSDYVQVASGLENVEADANAPIEYFNLQGMRVANPEGGIFIRRQGKSVSKVAL